MAPDGNYCAKKGEENIPPRRCHKDLGVNVLKMDCEGFCDTFVECIGYAYSISPAGGWCHLFTRQENTCPSGFSYFNGAVIMSIDEFDGRQASIWGGCYAKSKPSDEFIIYCTIFLYII